MTGGTDAATQRVLKNVVAPAGWGGSGWFWLSFSCQALDPLSTARERSADRREGPPMRAKKTAWRRPRPTVKLTAEERRSMAWGTEAPIALVEKTCPDLKARIARVKGSKR